MVFSVSGRRHVHGGLIGVIVVILRPLHVFFQVSDFIGSTLTCLVLKGAWATLLTGPGGRVDLNLLAMLFQARMKIFIR